MLNMIWAQANNGVIGQHRDIPWHLPADLAHFKRLTSGHTVLMGRRTWESLPPKVRPLPDRRNVVLSRNPEYVADGAEVTTSLLYGVQLPGEVWVIGGGQIYNACIALASRVVITTVDTDVEGDTYAPALRTGEWELHTHLTGALWTINDWRRKEW